jgi:hypothetical protein
MLVDNTPGLQMASVTGAIQKAAKLTGTSFQYLLATAKVESNLNPDAAARTSSAGGLFQFIEQTWLQTLKEAGPALGYGHYAAAISQDESGRFSVTDPKMRAEIMNLRRDPAANATMAGAFTQSNAAYLKERLGRKPTDGELYIAHFMGANGAARLIGQASDNPDANAAELFPGAARANKSIFFDKSGKPRNFAEVASALSGKFDVAQAASAPASAPVAPRVETARVARSYDAASPLALAQRAAAASGEPVYSNPYRTAERKAPVAQVAQVAPAAPAVADLWAQAAAIAARGRQMAAMSKPAPVAQAASAAPAPQALSDAEISKKLTSAAMPMPPQGVDLLSLFQDSKPNYRGLFTRS